MAGKDNKKAEEPKRSAPQFFYGPGDAARVFQPDEDVPDGWEDHPRKVADFVEPVKKLDL